MFQAPPQRGFTTMGDYTVDGRRFLLMAPAEQGSAAPFTVVLNWQADVRK